MPRDSPYLVVYPFVKVRPWYALPEEERQRAMDEHIRIGRDEFATIHNHTTYSFGIDDQEFMTAFECDEPADFMHLMLTLRETRGVPLHRARHADLRRAADRHPRRARRARRRRRPRRGLTGSHVTGDQEQWQLDQSAAELYQRHFVRAVTDLWAADLVERADVADGERVLDVACGTGVVARHAATRAGVRGRVEALDVNPAILAFARRLPAPVGAPVAWREASALALPYAARSFDVVLLPARPAVLPGPTRRVAGDAPHAGSGWPARAQRVRPDRAQPGDSRPRRRTRSSRRTRRVAGQASGARARGHGRARDSPARSRVRRTRDRDGDEDRPVRLPGRVRADPAGRDAARRGRRCGRSRVPGSPRGGRDRRCVQGARDL